MADPLNNLILKLVIFTKKTVHSRRKIEMWESGLNTGISVYREISWKKPNVKFFIRNSSNQSQFPYFHFSPCSSLPSKFLKTKCYNIRFYNESFHHARNLSNKNYNS